MPLRMSRRCLVFLLLAACGGTSPRPRDTTPRSSCGDAPDAGGTDAACACPIDELSPPDEGGAHIAACEPRAHNSNPPASGAHYGDWPVFRVYDKPVPWGYLLHAMEHGAVVVAHNCPGGCPDAVAAARAMIEATPRKQTCPSPRPPVIMTPDPALDVPWAAAAWGRILRAQCFDRTAFARFITENANRGPELIPSDCGSFDGEARGRWCP